MFAVDPSRRIQTWNPGAQRLLGRTERRSSADDDTLMSEAAFVVFRAAVDRSVPTSRGPLPEPLARADGSEVDVAVSVSPMRDPEGALIGFATTARDITHQLAAQAELAAARADREVMADRDRIARDLHDMVIQRVFGAGLACRASPPAWTIPTPLPDPDGDGRARRHHPGTARHHLQSPPAAAEGDQPPRPGRRRDRHGEERLGFEPAVEFQGPVDAALPDATAVQLLAVLREALSNVVSHARAPRSGRRPRRSELLLEVADNGRGLGPPPAAAV